MTVLIQKSYLDEFRRVHKVAKAGFEAEIKAIDKKGDTATPADKTYRAILESVVRPQHP